jgi:hypothetical protein
MREHCTSGSVRGAPGNRRPYRGDGFGQRECCDVISEEWKILQEEAGDEAIEYKVVDIRRSNFTTMPEGIHLWLLDNDFPETTLWREGDSLVCEITEHIYSKFWWHKFSAGAFSEAMERAVVRLSCEGHPFREPSVESDDDIHIWVRWQLVLPVDTPSERIVESIKAAFDLVWQRADSILEHSDSVLILGKDSGPALEVLKHIVRKLQELGYYTYIIKEQPDRIGESVVQKVLRYALSSKFVVIENSELSGHLYEILHVTKLAECVTVVLQEEGKGATWMFEDAYAKHNHWWKIIYPEGEIEQAVEHAATWAEEFSKRFARYQIDHLPWLYRSC